MDFVLGAPRATAESSLFYGSRCRERCRRRPLCRGLEVDTVPRNGRRSWGQSLPELHRIAGSRTLEPWNIHGMDNPHMLHFGEDVPAKHV